jgi:hypothetical protein
MNKANIKAIKPKRRHYYPNTGKFHKRADNLLDRELTPLCVIWCGVFGITILFILAIVYCSRILLAL